MDPPNLLYMIPANITLHLLFSRVRQRTESRYCDFLNLLTKMRLSHISVRLAPFSMFYKSCQKIYWPQVFISNKTEEYHNFNRQISLEWPSCLMQIRRSGSPPTAEGRGRATAIKTGEENSPSRREFRLRMMCTSLWLITHWILDKLAPTWTCKIYGE